MDVSLESVVCGGHGRHQEAMDRWCTDRQTDTLTDKDRHWAAIEELQIESFVCTDLPECFLSLHRLWYLVLLIIWSYIVQQLLTVYFIFYHRRSSCLFGH
jgi:hypothetical protein